MYRRMKNSKGICVLPVIWRIIFNLPVKNGFFKKPNRGCDSELAVLIFTFYWHHFYITQYLFIPWNAIDNNSQMWVLKGSFYEVLFHILALFLTVKYLHLNDIDVLYFCSCTFIKSNPIFAGLFTYSSLAPWITVQECFLQLQRLTHLWVAEFLL